MSSPLKTSAYIATSLDGYIARADGGLDWLPVPTSDEDYGYAAFMKSVDFIVMGRRTFEIVEAFAEWPYQQKSVVVLTTKPFTASAHIPVNVEAMAGTPAEIIDRLAERGAQHLYIDGGVTIQRFLRAGAIQRLIVTRVPVLLGAGIPLFGSLHADIPLRHVETRSFPDGLVQSEYEIAEAEDLAEVPSEADA